MLLYASMQPTMTTTKSAASRRSLPFLHRNWINTINHLQSAPIAAEAKPVHAQPQSTNGHIDPYRRPAKRRRLSDTSPDSGIGHDIDSALLFDDPADFHRAIRIEVLRIAHKDFAHPRAISLPMEDGSIPPALKHRPSIKARCKITITTCIPAPSPPETRILYCDSQTCTIKTIQNHGALPRMARVYLPQPFHIPQDKLCVERHDDTVFDLADQYSVLLELESAGDPNWPPLDLAAAGSETDVFSSHSQWRHWKLAADITRITDGGRRSGPLKICKGAGDGVRTDFLLDVDVRAATALPERALCNGRGRASRASPYAAALDDQPEQHEPLSLTNGLVNQVKVDGILTNGHSGLVDDDMEEEAEGEITPGRSLRIRGSQNYNLKDLINRALGRKSRKSLVKPDSNKADSDRVLYYLPREAAPVKEVLVLGFACCFCCASHQSLAQLRAHLPSHSQYRFEVVLASARTGGAVEVSCTAVNEGFVPRPKVYQLGKPTGPFDIDKYVEGDDSWVKSRLGPQNEEEPAAPVRKAPQAKTSQTRLSQKSGGRRKDRKFLVPDTKQPLFDALSKVRLVPGTEVRQSAADEGWLIQKHRDIVQDFVDVDAAEKDYIKQWDAFIQKRRISSDAFISRAVLEFVNENMQWLLSSRSRIQEFGKHLIVLIARGLEDDVVRQIQTRIQEARIQKPVDTAPGPAHQHHHHHAPAKELPRRSPRGCAVCGWNVRGPQLLICSNEDCRERLYHEDCIRDRACMPTEALDWLCNKCAWQMA